MSTNNITYYDLQKNWTRKIVPHLNDPEVQKNLVRDFNKYTMGRWGVPFKPGMLPEEVESCDWRWNTGRRGPMPQFWRYVKHSACHWVVNFALALAKLAEPNKPWRIVTSAQHSTVWDGDKTLFEFNFLALGVHASEAWQMARFGENAEVLSVGQEMPVPYAEFFLLEMGRERAAKYLEGYPIEERKKYLVKLLGSLKAQVHDNQMTEESALTILYVITTQAAGLSVNDLDGISEMAA